MSGPQMPTELKFRFRPIRAAIGLSFAKVNFTSVQIWQTSFFLLLECLNWLFSSTDYSSPLNFLCPPKPQLLSLSLCMWRLILSDEWPQLKTIGNTKFPINFLAISGDSTHFSLFQKKTKKSTPQGQGGSPEFCFTPNLIFLWVKTPCKISEPYNNPFLEKSKCRRKKKLKEKKIP